MDRTTVSVVLFVAAFACLVGALFGFLGAAAVFLVGAVGSLAGVRQKAKERMAELV